MTNEEAIMLIQSIPEKIKNLPSVEPQIIYCKECAYNESPSDSGNVLCGRGHDFFQLYDFCSDGKRRTDDL